MEKSFTEEMKEILLETKTDILKSLAEERADLKAMVSGDVRDLVDEASSDIDRRFLEAMSYQDRQRLEKVNAALSRIENQRYGLCKSCGKKIPQERLRALPYATQCIDCKKQLEKKNGHR